ncbi:MAG: hypothetical protein ACJATI_004725 [Halioglobus sp.]
MILNNLDQKINFTFLKLLILLHNST